jgi:hypothetical protein
VNFDVGKGLVMVVAKKKKTGRARTISLRVGEVLGDGDKQEIKQEFYRVVRKSLRLSRRVANLVYSELRKRDPLQPGLWMNDLYTYPVVKFLNEGGISTQISSICRRCEEHYKKVRKEIAAGERVMPSSRNAVWPLLHNKSVKTMRLVDNGEFVTCEVSLVDGWYKFRIRGGSNYRDQINGLKLAMSQGHVGDSGLRFCKKQGVILDIRVVLPEVAARVGVVAKVFTTPDTLLSVSLPRSKRPFSIAVLEAREKKQTYQRKMTQLRIARKHGEDRGFLAEKRDRLCEHTNNWMTSFIHKATKQVIDYCLRNGVAVIEYDDLVRSALLEFPWFQLATTLKYKAADAGIVFDVAKCLKGEKTGDPTKPHVYFILDPGSERVKIGRSENLGKRLKSFWTSNPDWICLAVKNYPKGKEVDGEKHFLARFDMERIVDREKSGHEVRRAWPVLEFLREAGWLGNTGNRSHLMQIPFVEQFMDGAGDLGPEGDDETGLVAC